MFSPASLRWLLGLAGLFVLVFALAALSGPGRIDTVDAQTRYEVARSLVEHGDSIIRDKGTWFNVYEGRDGDRYSLYRFPQSGLGVAAIWAADLTAPTATIGAAREMRRHFFFLLTSAFCGAILALTYALWFRYLGHSPAASLAWALAGFVCTPSWFYSSTTFDDIVGTTGIVVAVAAAWIGRHRAPLVGASIAGIALAWAVNSKQPLGIFGLVVLAAMYRPELPLRKQLLPWLVTLFWLGAGCVACVLYERYKFPPGTTDPNAEFVRHYGDIYTSNPLPGLSSFALSTSCGVFFYCPALYLALRGWWTWRKQERVLCWSVAAASALFMLFLSFVTFFKGEHGWGPRYLTPMFAIWWVFVPSAVAQVRVFVMRGVLALGIVIQILGLAVDPTRLFLTTPVQLDYFLYDPWLTFHPSLSHLLQRPREIVEVVSNHDPEPEFAPAPLTTHAGGLHEVSAYLAAQMVATSFAPGAGAANPVAHVPVNLAMSGQATMASLPNMYQQMGRRYHIYNSLRPWWISQRTLPKENRPVDHARALTFLLALCGLGTAMMILPIPWSRRNWESMGPGASGVGRQETSPRGPPSTVHAPRSMPPEEVRLA
jgi:hypothetical protein